MNDLANENNVGLAGRREGELGERGDKERGLNQERGQWFNEMRQ